MFGEKIWDSFKTIESSNERVPLAVTLESIESRLLLQKWIAHHGTPTRMLSENAPNLTAEVSKRVHGSLTGLQSDINCWSPTPQGLVERQNRTLLTLQLVFCFRRMRDWDQHFDEVLGAYDSTRHATIGFSPYMLTRATENAIPLT